jgi:hypothetical protein
VRQEIFFTRNGQYLAAAFRRPATFVSSLCDLYPAVSLVDEGDAVIMHFSPPFQYDAFLFPAEWRLVLQNIELRAHNELAGEPLPANRRFSAERDRHPTLVVPSPSPSPSPSSPAAPTGAAESFTLISALHAFLQVVNAADSRLNSDLLPLFSEVPFVMDVSTRAFEELALLIKHTIDVLNRNDVDQATYQTYREVNLNCLCILRAHVRQVRRMEHLHDHQELCTVIRHHLSELFIEFTTERRVLPDAAVHARFLEEVLQLKSIGFELFHSDGSGDRFLSLLRSFSRNTITAPERRLLHLLAAEARPSFLRTLLASPCIVELLSLLCRVQGEYLAASIARLEGDLLPRPRADDAPSQSLADLGWSSSASVVAVDSSPQMTLDVIIAKAAGQPSVPTSGGGERRTPADVGHDQVAARQADASNHLVEPDHEHTLQHAHAYGREQPRKGAQPGPHKGHQLPAGAERSALQHAVPDAGAQSRRTPTSLDVVDTYTALLDLLGLLQVGLTTNREEPALLTHLITSIWQECNVRLRDLADLVCLLFVVYVCVCVCVCVFGPMTTD